MSAPFIGSRISLISKSDVRYEGILCGIDTNESKVYLQHVRCFGTEDRRKDNPIAPASEVYEVIIFHSSDIKDLSVCELPPPVAYDPMNFNSFSHMGSGYPPQYGYPPMVHPQYGPQYGYPYNPYHNYGMYPQTPSMMGTQEGAGGFPPSSPPSEQGSDKPLSLQPPQKINVTTSKVDSAQTQPSSQGESSESAKNNADNLADNNAKSEASSSDDSNQKSTYQKHPHNNNYNKRNNNRNNNNFVYLPKGEAQKSGNNQVERTNENAQTADSSTPQTHAASDQSNNRHNQDYRQKRGGSSNNRGYKGHSHSNRRGFDSHSRSHNAGSDKPKDPSEIKTQEDFDFLISNAKFEKLSISGELEKEFPKISPSYNKDSFYDNISCDTLDREDSKEKKSYYEQRKLDSETFGDIGRRSNRGGSRTRGRYDTHSQGNTNQKRYNNYSNRGNRNYRGNKSANGNSGNTPDNATQN